MKKRVLSALLVLCMACSMVSTVWAANEQATPETAATASPASSPTPDVSAYPARTVEQTIEDAGVTVKVDVPAGSLPADAQLTAELIGSSEDDAADQAVTDVAEELTAANVDYDGFVALDISFVGANGEEIEPLQPVSVSFSLPADLLPAEADPATLAVQHLAEDETGEVETVETVADVADETDGTIAVDAVPAVLSAVTEEAPMPQDAEITAEFEIGGFSTFTITWEESWKSGNNTYDYKTSLTVYRINENGTGIGDDFVISHESSQHYDYVEVDRIVSVNSVEGYTFEKAVVAPNASGALSSHLEVNRLRLELNKKYSEIDPKWQYISSSGDWKDIPDGYSVYFIYETNYELTIDDSELLSSGKLIVHDESAPEGTTYVWYKDGESVVRKAVTEIDGQNQYNVAADGSWLNVTLDEGAQATYTVKRVGNEAIASPPYKVPYYDSLQNGDFEKNAYNYEGGYAEHFVPSGAEDIVWKTTGYNENLGSRIELVGKDTYRWHGVNYCPPAFDAEEGSNTSSNQCAELNADSEGALYQDVLTMPGSTMNWSLMHNGRTRNNGDVGVAGKDDPDHKEYSRDNPASDTMYVLIMSTDLAMNSEGKTYEGNISGEIDTQSEIAYVQQHMDKFYGASITEITYEWYWGQKGHKDGLYVQSKQNGEVIEDWTFYAKDENEVQTVWMNHTGSYKVPDNQYLTRYFFVSGPTELGEDAMSGEKDAPYTVGNHIDNVYFGTGAPPAPSGSATLEIVKNVTGLTDDKFDDLLKKLEFTVKIGDTTQVVNADDEAFIWEGPVGEKTGTYLIQSIRIPAGQTVSYTVTESVSNATVEGYTLTTKPENQDGSVNITGTLTDGSIEIAKISNIYTAETPETVDLTLTKTFDGLSDAEVEYLIKDAKFGWDVNFCSETLRISYDDEGNAEAITYMADAKDIPDDLRLPGVKDKNDKLTQLTGGGDFSIDAVDYLPNWNKNQTNFQAENIEKTKASSSFMKDSVTGNWTLTITIEVPTTDEDHFYTVFEQHQEVPGYAKINDSNAEYTITQDGEQIASGTGKFVDHGVTGSNVYEDMKTEVEKTEEKTLNDKNGEEFSQQLEGEEAAIDNRQLTRLEITEDTTIAFTNHYTGNLDVTKKIGTDNDYTDANTKEYTLTIAPAHLWKLDFEKDATESTDPSSINHGLNGKSVSYYIETADGNRVDEDGKTLQDGAYATKPLDANGSFNISITPDQIIHFSDMPAIQWKVTENDATVGDYTLTTAITDTNGDATNGFVVDDNAHWNKYEGDDVIGATKGDDGIASVDSAKRDVTDKNVKADAVALVTVTNTYKRNFVTLTVDKTVTGAMGNTDEDFTFILTLSGGEAPDKLSVKYNSDRETTSIPKATNANTYTFYLTHGEHVEILIPSGTTAVVTETEANGYDVRNRVDHVADTEADFGDDGKPIDDRYTDSNNTGSIVMSDDHSVEFVNFRDVVPPTGLESNHTTPYVLMITAAGMAGLALIGGIVARRVRRRRQE